MAIFKFTFKGEANFGWIRGNVLLALGGSLVKGGRDCQGSTRVRQASGSEPWEKYYCRGLNN